MKTCLLLLPLLAGLLAGLLAPAAARAAPYEPLQRECVPGETKALDCNTCTCSDAGLFACTLLPCEAQVKKPACPHGRTYIDQCENRCTCELGGGYTCTEKGCFNGTPREPMNCEVDGEIRVYGNTRLFCKHGIVHFEPTAPHQKCPPGLSWQEDCNTCGCSPVGIAFCTKIACDVPDRKPFLCSSTVEGCSTGPAPQPVSEHCTPGVTWQVDCNTCVCSPDGTAACTEKACGPHGGGEFPHPDPGSKRYCDGPCPADCGEVLDQSRHCYTCQCLPELLFGDTTVPVGTPCPQGLREGPSLLSSKICRSQGCTPDATWTVQHDGCSTCVCTRDGEPACTPCRRSPSELTVTCEDGLSECPQDCGSSYNQEKDCYDCPCAVGEPGDVHVQFGEKCPAGTDFRESGAFFQACGPVDSLPKGDTKVCDTQDCPADCATVRISRKENCAYCQCSPVLARGDETVSVYEECRSPLVPGPVQSTTKVCKAPTREECVPGTTYNLNCDICICQDEGVPACTKRDCSQPKYGDVQVCDAAYQECPADCMTASADSYCHYCQCGPPLQEGDVTVPIDEDCPSGLIVKETQFVTKTCSPDPASGSKQYCDGPCPAECGEVLDHSRQCYTCQCGPGLKLGDVEVPIDAPCPDGLREGPIQVATKVCQGQGCTPGATWNVHHDECSTCVCTAVREPACTPCSRVASEFTVTCKDGARECPQDCLKKYNPAKDCYDCACDVGQPGDVRVDFGQECPPGTDFRTAASFFQVCGPVDSLPKGDTKVCDTQDCPGECGTVRISSKENCAYCQCGPVLAPGDVTVPVYEECRSPLVPGPVHLVTKVCKAPTRGECLPGTTYNLGCDICICQENGVPACTLRNCSDPQYGDVQLCGSDFQDCPADCGPVSSDSYCHYCQCGPRLPADVTVGIEEDCPSGLVVKSVQFATKTCTAELGTTVFLLSTGGEEDHHTEDHGDHDSSEEESSDEDSSEDSSENRYK